MTNFVKDFDQLIDNLQTKLDALNAAGIDRYVIVTGGGFVIDPIKHEVTSITNAPSYKNLAIAESIASDYKCGDGRPVTARRYIDVLTETIEQARKSRVFMQDAYE
jgi:hypothetical protein